MTAIPAHIRTAIKSGPVPVLREVAGLPAAALTRGERIINFIERYCVVPEGELVGKPVVLDVFPADAGMNRATTFPADFFACVPRRRGDEPPFLQRRRSWQKCSPQTRG